MATYELNQDEEKWILEQRKRRREEAYADVVASELLSLASRIIKSRLRDDGSCYPEVYNSLRSLLTSECTDLAFQYSLSGRCCKAVSSIIGAVIERVETEFKPGDHQEFMACLKETEERICAK